jgi:hypothetical protein
VGAFQVQKLTFLISAEKLILEVPIKEDFRDAR